MKTKVVLSSVFLMLFLFAACNKNPVSYYSYDDVIINVRSLSTRTIGDQKTKISTISFTIKNIGQRKIKYWLISFNLHFNDNPKIKVVGKFNVELWPGETSLKLFVSRDIPKLKTLTHTTILDFQIR